LFQIKEAKAKSFKNVYAKDNDADLERLRTAHLNNDEETEVEQSDLVDGNLLHLVYLLLLFTTRILEGWQCSIMVDAVESVKLIDIGPG